MNTVWKHKPDIDAINSDRMSGTIMERLGIRITEVGEDFIRGTMPADSRTFQPYGVVHGGANVVLAETLGSVASAHAVESADLQVFGQEVSASHIRSVSSGLVTGTARPIHIGRRSQIWEIRLENDEGKLTCLSKLTMAVVPTRN